MAPSPKGLTIAVVSDLHAFATVPASGRVPSAIAVGGAASAKSRPDPLEAALDLVADEGLSADVLVCCGDLGHKAETAAIEHAWREVRNLGARLGAEVVATCGNHDVDSRYGGTAYDPLEVLKSLDEFPTSDQALNAQYWAYHYAVRDLPHGRVVTLNSSAYHTVPTEIERGRVADPTVARLASDLVRSPREHNVLLTHHHPQKFGDVIFDDVSDMIGAPVLLDVLGSGFYGDWIVIHGHRHFPWLSYAAGGAGAPVVFAAGSLSATPWDQYPRQTACQFYVLETGARESDVWGGGRFRAWTWAETEEWAQSVSEGGLPPEGGFGLRRNLADVATSVVAFVAASTDPYVTWGEVEKAVPGLGYLLPRDRNDVLERLEREGRINVDRSPSPSTDRLSSP